MRATYLQRREPFDEILVRTLKAGWEAQYGAGIDVRLQENDGRGRRWLLQPLLNGYYVPEAGSAVRTFLRENFRHTVVRRRAAAQWVLGTLLAHPIGLRLTGRTAFFVDGILPSERNLLVTPGSQRIRVFDFERGCSRVMLKDGFDSAPMRREIAVRGRGEGPFPGMTAWSEDAQFFEEPILDALPLGRVPERRDFERLEREAIETLEQWLTNSKEDVSVDDRLELLVVSIEDDLDRLGNRLEATWRLRLRRWTEQLADGARQLGVVPVADSHGDLMRDNIMVDRSNRRVILIDWERCRRRYFWYDRLVYSLDSRFPEGLGERLRAFARGATTRWEWEDLPRDEAWRRAALALFLLEDLVGNLRVNASSPIYGIAEDFRIYLSELDGLGPCLETILASQKSTARGRTHTQSPSCRDMQRSSLETK